MRGKESYLWTTLVIKSCVQIRASDKPLYNLQDTCLESITSMTTVKNNDRSTGICSVTVNVAASSGYFHFEKSAHHRLKTR